MKSRFVFSSFTLLVLSTGLLIVGAEMVRLISNYAAGGDVWLNGLLILTASVVTTYVLVRSYDKTP